MLRKWIQLKGPQVSLNAPNVLHKIQMTYSPVIAWDLSAHQIINTKVPQGVRHLIFNCHGFVSRPNFPVPHLSLGTTFTAANVSAFDPLASMDTLRVIWISACNLGSSAAGLDFCKEIARHSMCYVVTHIMGVPDTASRANHVEDYTYCMPLYISPMGDMVKRSDFFSWGGDLGFSKV